MKRSKLLFGSIVVCTIILSSCYKQLEEKVILPTVDEEDASSLAISGCRIQFISGMYESYPDKLTIRYNYYGNPISVKSSIGPATGRPDYQFRYDASNRLTDCIGVYSDDNPYFEFWSKYTYNNRNQIAIDTTYIFGRKGATPKHYLYKRFTTYTYDAQNRIIKEALVWSKSSGGGGFEINYSYDGNGNLITGETYDHRTNIHRTHTVFAFIDRDYSVNNPQRAELYHHNLPIKLYIDPGADYPKRALKFLEFGITDSISIKYRCN